MDQAEKTSDGVRAVGRALEILLAFTPQDHELSATELLKRVDLSRPTLYRLLYTLEQMGFIVAFGEPQRFRLGPAVGKLAHIWTSSMDISTVAEPIVKRLWEATQETVAVFVPQGTHRRCVAELPSPQPLSFKRGVGYTELLVHGASGRAILAWMEPTAGSLRSMTSGTEVDPEQLAKELALTRKRQYAVSRNELIRGAIAVAAPFFDRTGKVAGSLGVFGPEVRWDDTKLKDLGTELVTYATQVSEALGFTG